jgi:hypothetical protein
MISIDTVATQYQAVFPPPKPCNELAKRKARSYQGAIQQSKIAQCHFSVHFRPAADFSCVRHNLDCLSTMDGDEQRVDKISPPNSSRRW